METRGLFRYTGDRTVAIYLGSAWGGRLIPPLKVQRNEVIVNYRNDKKADVCHDIGFCRITRLLRSTVSIPSVSRPSFSVFAVVVPVSDGCYALLRFLR